MQVFWGEVLRNFQSNIFLREDVFLWSWIFFNMGVSAAWMLTIGIFQINGLSCKKPGSIAINERQYSGCGFRVGGSCGRATSQMLDRRAMMIQIVELYRVKKDIKALKGFFGVNSG